MRSRLVGLGLCIAALTGGALPAKADLLAFVPSGGNVAGNSNTSFLGYQFTASTPVEVTGLGIVLPNTSTVSYEDHFTALFPAGSTTPLASTVITTGEAVNVGNAVINALPTPLTLSAGSYWIGAYYSSGDFTETMYDAGVTFNSASGLTWNNDLVNIDGDKNYDQIVWSSATQTGYFGPDFTFTSVPVPEPAAAGLFAVAACLLGFVSRRRRV